MIKQRKILVLEDDPDMREALGEALTEDGYLVVLARRGEEAVKLSSQEEFDLVVSDIKMPGMDGLEAVEQIQGHQPGMKSVIVSGYCTEQDSLRAEQLGVSEVINKPFVLDDLLHRIRLLIDEQDRRQQGKEKLADLETGALTSLRIITELIEKAQNGPLSKAGGLAAKLAAESDDPKGAFRAELLTLLAGCRELAPELRSPEFGEEMESLVRSVLSHRTGAGKAEDLNNSRFAEIASLALSTELGADESQPANFDPALMARLKDAFDNEASTLRESTAVGRNLLALGKAMEVANDLETAHSSYRELIADHANTREEVGGRLGLVRIALLAEDHDHLKVLAEEALLSASKRGETRPVIALELGLLLMWELPDLSRELLRDAWNKYRSINDLTRAGYARLALCALGADWTEETEQSLSLFMDSKHSRLLKKSVKWLLPLLLEQGHPAAKAIQLKFPSELLECLNSGHLSSEARKRVVETFKTTDRPASGSILRILAEDSTKEVSLLANRLLHSGDAPESPPLLKIFTFGQFEISFGESKLPPENWKRKKIRHLLAYLASAWRAACSEDKLLEVFWPGPMDRAKRSLYQATWEVRRLLKMENWPDLDYIQRNNGFLGVNRQEPVWVDIEEFEQTLERANKLVQRNLLSEATPLYSEAVNIARGPYLEDCYEDWAVQRQNSVSNGLMQAREFLARQALQDGTPQPALQHAQELLVLDSLHQPGQVLVMNSLNKLGQHQEALDRFQTFKRELQEGLQIEPSLDLLRAFEQAKLGLSGPSIG